MTAALLMMVSFGRFETLCLSLSRSCNDLLRLGTVVSESSALVIPDRIGVLATVGAVVDSGRVWYKFSNSLSVLSVGRGRLRIICSAADLEMGWYLRVTCVMLFKASETLLLETSIRVSSCSAICVLVGPIDAVLLDILSRAGTSESEECNSILS